MAVNKVYLGTKKQAVTTYYDSEVIHASRHDFEFMGTNKDIGYKVLIIDKVEEINPYAFQDLDFIDEVEIRSNLKVINDYAFSGCKELKEITIPSSVNYIGYRAFYDCNSLDLKLDSSLFYTSLDVSDTFLTHKVIIGGKEYKRLSAERLEKCRVEELKSLINYVAQRFDTTYGDELYGFINKTIASLFIDSSSYISYMCSYVNKNKMIPLWKKDLVDEIYSFLVDKKHLNYLNFDKFMKTEIERTINDFYELKIMNLNSSKEDSELKEIALDKLEIDEAMDNIKNMMFMY